ncbi:hypothetical protein FIA58_017315 [Flavobacterium jejuense]|uniref:Glycosyltransferase RgtA/B/C/D-like domain-containing protein n=1 Tax=Flavobacterium jejuense TaxID=1544455 RepID=A0ABX0IU81_9FLAO|nr:hypothetical protein [Flavobacterium jejuense]NHN27442.1 hypothetical protein [Flavobacterium jejuense]
MSLLLFVMLQWLGFDGLYGQDSYEYLRYSESIQNYIKTGEHPGAFYWPVLYPFFGSLLGFAFGSAAVGLHFLTCITVGITCTYLFKTLELFYPHHTKTNFYYILAFGLLSPYFLRSGLVVMSDMLSMLFIVITFYHFYKSFLLNSAFTYVFFFASCALMSRYASLVITFPIIILATYFVLKRKAIKDFILGSLLSLLICIPFIVLQWKNLSSGTSNYFLNAWSFSNYFKSSYETIDGMQSYLLPNLVFVFSVFVNPGFIFTGLILLFIIFSNLKSRITFFHKTTILSIAMYLSFLAGIPFQNTRVLTLVFPLVLLFFYPTFHKLTQFKWIQKNVVTLSIVVILVQVTFCIYAFKTVYKRTLFEKELSITLEPYQGSVLYGFEYDVALKGRGLNFNYRNMYNKLYNDFKENEFVFFNPILLKKQWNGKNPMINWNLMEKSYHLKVIKTFDDNWKLYQLISKK